MANKRRPQGDGTIRKRPDGRWEGRIIIGHKIKVRSKRTEAFYMGIIFSMPHVFNGIEDK